MNVATELGHLLRPAGGGVHLVSSGASDQRALQQKLYAVDSEEAVERAFRENLERIADARAVIVAVPSDVGAGFRRGANLGPFGIRQHVLQQIPSWSEWLSHNKIVDLGDVFVVPQLLHDDMISSSQRIATANALYPSVRADERAKLPVSPLSMAERVFDRIFEANPKVFPFLLGGDHSVAWPLISSLHRVRPKVGIVQPDAHTDLLAERLGIKICFATWSYHANELIGRDGRMIQVGTRASRHDRAHWESTLAVRQFWAEDCRLQPAETLDAILRHVSDKDLQEVYFSNDIDGTDAKWADATGTPEQNGLEPDFVVELIRRLGTRLVAGDVVEVAPPLSANPKTTLDLAVRYMRETLCAGLALSPPGD